MEERGCLRRNIIISPEMIQAQSGEAAKLLTKLNELDRNSKQARKIRRQLRKLGVRLSSSTEKEKHIKRSLRTSLLTRKQIKRKRKKLGLEVERTDQVLDTAQQLVLAKYKTPSQIAKRLMEIYPRIDSDRAGKAALQALIKKNPRKRYFTGFKRTVAEHVLRSNSPSEAKEIYGDILAIEAQKGKGSLFPNEKFRHKFQKGSKIYALPDGSVLIKGKKKLWKEFDY